MNESIKEQRKNKKNKHIIDDIETIQETEQIKENKQEQIKKIESENKNKIETIYQLADIHVRLFARHEEYRIIIQHFVEYLKLQKNNEKAIIVICGDILHSRTTNIPEGEWFVTKDILIPLSEIMPVIIILGNHDVNIADKTRLDLLTPLINPLTYNGNNKNLIFLKERGIYLYRNMGFGMTNVFDTEILQASKIPKVGCKIGLYHGQIYGAKTDAGETMNKCNVTVGSFDGYDLVLLGDIHKRQFMNANRTICYSGSMIQQNHGETLQNHGFVKWNVARRHGELKNLKNEYGFCTLNITEGNLDEEGKKLLKYEMPKYAKIRIISKNTERTILDTLKKDLRNKFKITEHIDETIIEDDNNNVNEPNVNDNLYNNITEFHKSLKSGEIEMILNIHREIEKHIDVDNINIVKKNMLILKKMTFRNILIYGENKINTIDFTNYRNYWIDSTKWCWKISNY